MTFLVNNINIDIKSPNGLYFFEKESSIGKTYLYNLLDSIGSKNNLLLYNCNLFYKGIVLEQLLNMKDYSLIFIDNYDLYPILCFDKLVELSNNSIILIDYKGYSNLYNYGELCTIEVTNDFIEVDSYVNF